MDDAMQAVRAIVDTAPLSDDVRGTVVWCLGRLPPLYRDLARTYDARYGDEIARLLRGVFQALAGQTEAAGAIAARLSPLHGRLGIPVPAFQALSAGRRSPRTRRQA
jgi:hypothetical protein